MLFRTRGTRSLLYRTTTLVVFATILILASTRLRADTGICGGQSITLPFTDVSSSNVFFCSIAQAFFTGLANGTTATTYSPSEPATREQMAAFITRTRDSALKRGSRRATAGQWAAPQDVGVLKRTLVGSGPHFSCFDGEDIWVANINGSSVTRVHASDGRVLGTWTGATGAHNTIAAAGFIYVTGATVNSIYRIDPSQPPGAVTVVENNVGDSPFSITYDGLNLWTANRGNGAGTGSITRYNIVTDIATNFAAGFSEPAGIVFDGTHLWVVDQRGNALHRVNPADGAILETIPIGTISVVAAIPVFDGSNIWVPVDNALQVVSTSTPARLLATLTGNGLGATNWTVAFDGERIMATSFTGGISLWKASSLTPLGNLNIGPATNPFGVCSDGLHFWISGNPSGSANDALLRF